MAFFSLKPHQGQVLQASQAGRDSTELASPQGVFSQKSASITGKYLGLSNVLSEFSINKSTLVLHIMTYLG